MQKILIRYLDKSIRPIPHIRTKYIVLHNDKEVKKFWNLVKKYKNIIISIQVLNK
jgi:hypothetical protein